MPCLQGPILGPRGPSQAQGEAIHGPRGTLKIKVDEKLLVFAFW